MQKYFFETPLNLDAVIQKATANEQAEKGVAHFQLNGNSSARVTEPTTLNKINTRDRGKNKISNCNLSPRRSNSNAK